MESMNRANKAARDKTAVDVVQALKLLIDLETSRFLKKKADAWNHNETLTPHGIKLRDGFLGMLTSMITQLILLSMMTRGCAK